MPKFSKLSLLTLVAIAGVAAASCSLAFNLGQDQCTVDGDCKKFAADAVCTNRVCAHGSTSTTTGSSMTTTGAGGSLPAGWECLGHFKYPDPMGMPITQKFQFLDALSQNPVSSITMKLCGPLDSNCASPTNVNLMPDAMGNLTVTEPMMPGFYLDAVDDSSNSTTSSSSSSSSSTGTGGGPGMCCDAAGMNCKAEPGPGAAYRESLAYLGSSAGSPTVIPPNLKTIRTITNDGLCSLAKIVGKTEDTVGHGVAVILTPNCNDVRSPGVIVQSNDVDGESDELYFKNSVPSTTATQTDAEGAVGWFNLPAPRSSTFTTRLLTPECMSNQSMCPLIGTATVFIRPGTLTYVHIGPSP
jgi:hypothetical protein